jgi:hypothetical protein
LKVWPLVISILWIFCISQHFNRDPNFILRWVGTGLLLNGRKPATAKSPTYVISNFWSLTSVARWYIFKPKIPIWVNFGGPCVGRCWYILLTFGQFSRHLVYFMAIWYSFPLFGTLYQEKSGNPAKSV